MPKRRSKVAIVSYVLQVNLVSTLNEKTLSQCDRPRFTPMRYNRLNYSLVHLNVFVYMTLCGAETLTLRKVYQKYLGSLRNFLERDGEDKLDRLCEK